MKKTLSFTSIIVALSISLSLAQVRSSRRQRKSNYGDIVITKVTSVYDGDTFRVNIEDYPKIIGDDMPTRISGIDCPETRDENKEMRKLAERAKKFTEDRLKKAKVIKLKNMKRGRYFWIVADVEVDGKDLGKMLIKEGLAERYEVR
ncbi:MAG: thermonuclease family protein [Planctomycetota bacterium]|jgi:endonuclease YncB( thermonuclease family)